MSKEVVFITCSSTKTGKIQKVRLSPAIGSGSVIVRLEKG